MGSVWAIRQEPRCYIKKNATNRNYRNDWCISCIQGQAHCEACSIAEAYKAGDIEVKPGQLLPPSLEYYHQHGGLCALRPITSRADLEHPDFYYREQKHRWCNGMGDCNKCSTARVHREAQK